MYVCLLSARWSGVVPASTAEAHRERGAGVSEISRPDGYWTDVYTNRLGRVPPLQQTKSSGLFKVLPSRDNDIHFFQNNINIHSLRKDK